jgi:ATP-dependent DNA ligase
MFIKDFKTTQGIISSNPEESINRQKKTGYIQYIIFDVLFYKYNDLRTLTFSTRRKVLEEIFNNNELSHFIKLSETIKIYKKEFYKSQISQGLEGIMLKNSYSDYYDKNGLVKVKKTERYTMLIKGYTKGQGKYTGQIGTILVGWNDHENLTKASGMDDEIRLKISQNPEKYLNTVVEIEGAELTEKKRLRHPRFIDWRIDKTEKDCSVNQNAIIK